MREQGMADKNIVEIACTRAWGVYLLIHRGIDENDARREKLRHFICERWKAGTEESELLAVEGLKFLKTLDGSPIG
jgi:hypothetical protein